MIAELIRANPALRPRNLMKYHDTVRRKCSPKWMMIYYVNVITAERSWQYFLGNK